MKINEHEKLAFEKRQWLLARLAELKDLDEQTHEAMVKTIDQLAHHARCAGMYEAAARVNALYKFEANE